MRKESIFVDCVDVPTEINSLLPKLNGKESEGMRDNSVGNTSYAKMVKIEVMKCAVLCLRWGMLGEAMMPSTLGRSGAQGARRCCNVAGGI
jgi:hypothetical protein